MKRHIYPPKGHGFHKKRNIGSKIQIFFPKSDFELIWLDPTSNQRFWFEAHPQQSRQAVNVRKQSTRKNRQMLIKTKRHRVATYSTKRNRTLMKLKRKPKKWVRGRLRPGKVLGTPKRLKIGTIIRNWDN